jgi:transposase
MDILHTNCAGLDVHKKTVVATVIITKERGKPFKTTQTFGTMTCDLLALSDWLMKYDVTHTAMESTGEYWKPIYNILEDNFEVWLVNAQHIKAVPGRKTDIKDSEWIAELMRHGLIRANFVPPKGQREFRELTRMRSTFVKERATLVNRLQKVLESANIKLASVASDVNGVSGRAILPALIAGRSTPEEMAELAQGKLRRKRELLGRSLQGLVKPHHCFVLSELLLQIDGLDDAIDRLTTRSRSIVTRLKRRWYCWIQFQV